MHIAEFGHPDRQIAVGLQAVLEDLHMAGAVHRLEREGAGVFRLVVRAFHLEHVLLVPAPVAGGLPQALVEHLRRIHLVIAIGRKPAAHVAHKVLEHAPALGMPEHDARSLLLEMEQVHFAAKATVVALFGLFQHVEILVEFLLRLPGCAVDAGQHRVVGIAAPVGAGHLHQLESLADLTGRDHVRSPAEVEPVALRVDIDVLVLGDCVDQLDLVALALLGEHFLGLVTRPDFPGERLVARNDLRHLPLNDRQVFGREGLIAGKIVIEAVLDHRADGDLGAGPEFLHGFGEHVRGIVPDQFQRARVVAGDDLKIAGRTDRLGKVAHCAIERIGDGLLCERLGDAGCNVSAGRRRVIFTNGAIGKF